VIVYVAFQIPSVGVSIMRVLLAALVLVSFASQGQAQTRGAGQATSKPPSLAAQKRQQWEEKRARESSRRAEEYRQAQNLARFRATGVLPVDPNDAKRVQDSVRLQNETMKAQAAQLQAMDKAGKLPKGEWGIAVDPYTGREYRRWMSADAITIEPPKTPATSMTSGRMTYDPITKSYQVEMQTFRP
jgi:hypothetical protein